MDSELTNLALKSTPAVMIDAADYLNEKVGRGRHSGGDTWDQTAVGTFHQVGDDALVFEFKSCAHSSPLKVRPPHTVPRPPLGRARQGGNPVYEGWEAEQGGGDVLCGQAI